MSIDYCQLSPSLTPSSATTHSLPPSTEQYNIFSASSASSTSASLYPNLNNNLNSNNMDQSTSSNSSNSNSSSRQPPPPPPPRMSSNQSHHHNQTSNDTNESKFKIPSSSNSSESESTSKPVPNARNHIQPNQQQVQQQQIKQEQSFKQESSEPESNRDQSDNPNQTSSPHHSPSDGIHTGTNSNSYSNLTSGASTPPAFRWQRDFRLLISDPEGLRLFRQYILEELGNCLIVDFYFACESIQCQENRESIPRLARAILRKFINEKTVNSLLGLSDEVKNHLVHIFPKLPKSGNTTESSSEEFDESFYLNLFNDAKQEVYNSLSGPYYDNFIRSDIYLRSLSEIYQTQPDGYPTVYSEAHNAEATPSPRNGPLIKSESDPDLGIHEPNIHQVESSLQVLPPTYDSITGLTYLPINSHSNNYPNDGFRNFGPLPTLDEVTEHDETLSNIEDDAEVSATLANQQNHQNLENLLQNPQQNPQQNPHQQNLPQNIHQNLQPNLHHNLQQNQHQQNQQQQSLLPQQPSRPGTLKRTNGITSTSEYFESSSDSGYSGIEGRMSSLSLNNPRILTGSGASRAYQRSQSPIVMMSTTGDNGKRGGAVLGTVPGTAPYRYGDGGITYEQSPSHNSRMMRSYWDARKLISSGKPPPNPYHIAYSTVIPNSARDSEIQSISSNSTSDSYSALVFNNRQLRQVGSKPVGPNNQQRQLPRPSTGVAHPGQLSKAINALRGQQGGPEGPSGPTGPDPTQNQEQFAKLLIKKLGELIESSRMNQRLFQQMREIDSDSSSSTNVAVNPNPADMKKATVPGQKPDFGQNLKDAFKSKRFDFGPPERETDCQSILDKHCALVFDETPTNSGTPNTAPATGQPQAPGVAAAVVPTVAAQPTVQQAVQPTSNQAPSQYLLDGANHAPRYFNNYPPNHQQQIRVPSGGGSHISQVPVPYMNGHYPPPARTHLPPTSPLLHPNGHFNFMVPQNPGHPHQQHPHHHQQQVSSILVTVKFSDEDFPYKLTMVGPDVTLRAFKQSIPSKKGKFRFYFKRNSTEHEQKENHTAFMQELIEDDSAILPQCEGKIFATAHQQI